MSGLSWGTQARSLWHRTRVPCTRRWFLTAGPPEPSLLLVDFDDGHSDRGEVVLTVVLTCISLVIISVEHLFMCLLATWMLSLEKCLFRSFAHFFLPFFKLSCVSCLCSLAIKPLLVELFANIFSHSVNCLFLVSSPLQKVIS